MDIYWIIKHVGEITAFFNILFLICYILSAWGLYIINKKLGNKYAWISFIPIIQLFSYKDASGLSWKKIFGWFFGTLIGVILLSFILNIIINYLILQTNAALDLGQEHIRNINDIQPNNYQFTISIISHLFAYLTIILPILVIKYLISSGISKNTGRGGWTTFGLFFIPCIILPIIGYKLKPKKV